MIEQTFDFGSSKHLVGTITHPASATVQVRRTAVLLTNAGVISRVGPRRLNVKLARRFADMGIPCLRWDMSGLGDSQRPREPLPSRQQFIADTGDAIDEAAARLDVDSFIMIGFCSGAEIAFRRALQDSRLVAAVLFDHHIYPSRRAALRWYSRRLGETDLRELPRLVARGLGARYHALRQRVVSRAQQAGPRDDSWAKPSRDEYARQITALLDRGAELLFLYSGTMPEIFNARAQFNELYAKHDIPRRVTFDFRPDFDHLVTTEDAQQRLLDTVLSWVSERVKVRD